MFFIAYSILFSHFGNQGFMSTTNVELDREVPHWWVMSMVLEVGKILSRSWQDHCKIISPCNIVVLCVCYGLICSLVTMHDHGTCTLTELVVCKMYIAKLPKNSSCMVLVSCPSITHVHPLSTTWSLVRGSSMCNVVCSLPGQPY